MPNTVLTVNLIDFVRCFLKPSDYVEILDSKKSLIFSGPVAHLINMSGPFRPFRSAVVKSISAKNSDFASCPFFSISVILP